MTDKVKQMAPQILEEINKANNILLHCHPSTDGDSVGSSSGMMHYLKSLGKNVTVIAGDDVQIPNFLKIIPGANQILEKTWFDIDPKQFDLFIINDSSSIERVSSLGEVKFPENMKTVVIDHHASNTGFGDLNLTIPDAISTCEIVVDLLNEWKASITEEIATCLFIGLYTDSGGFQYKGTTAHTFDVASQLAKKSPNFYKYVFDLQNSNAPEDLIFQGLALTHLERYFKDKIVLSCVDAKNLEEHGITEEHAIGSIISNIVKSVIGWDIGISFIERKPGEIYVSMRTRNADKYDLSKVAIALGGGGHKAAAATRIKKPFNEAKQLLLETIQKVYPELGKP